MVERHGRTDMTGSLKPRGSGAMTGAGALQVRPQRKARQSLALGQACGPQSRQQDETSRNCSCGR